MSWLSYGFTQLSVTQSERGVDLVVVLRSRLRSLLFVGFVGLARALRSCRLGSRYVGFAWSWLYVVSNRK